MVRITTLKINQTVVHDGEGSTFFSYDTPICTRHYNGSITMYHDWCYSKTTSKYRAEFLGESTAVSKRKLMDGTYQLRKAYAKN